MAKMNRALQVRKIREDLVRNGYDPELVDVAALVDGTLSLPENRKNVAQQLRYKLGKQPSARTVKKRANVDYCDDLRHRCEVKGSKDACQEYGRTRCSSVTGKIEGCRICNTAGVGRKKKAIKSKAVFQDGQCMIPVKAYHVPTHMRKCSPRTAAKVSATKRGRYA